MENKNLCSGISKEIFERVYECEACGNHVCKACAVVWRGVCPHCFGRLNRIS